jgi:hypothetical protein
MAKFDQLSSNLDRHPLYLSCMSALPRACQPQQRHRHNITFLPVSHADKLDDTQATFHSLLLGHPHTFTPFKTSIYFTFLFHVHFTSHYSSGSILFNYHSHRYSLPHPHPHLSLSLSLSLCVCVCLYSTAT